MREFSVSEAAKVMEAAGNGAAIESRPRAFDGVDWEEDGFPSWDWVRREYRVAYPGHDVVPWQILHRDILWVARDEDGTTWGYHAHPGVVISGGVWKPAVMHSIDKSTRDIPVELGRAVEIKTSGRPWYESLQRRPASPATPAGVGGE